MKKWMFTLSGLVTIAAATAQNGTSGPLGVYGSLYDGGTTINSGGNIFVSSGGLWFMGGNITSADKGGANAPTALGRSEVITFDGSGTYGGATVTPGVTGNVINGYATSTAAWAGTVLPLGNGVTAYPLTIPAATSVQAAYFDGAGSFQSKIVSGFTQSTTEFGQYYDFPESIPAGTYTISYPKGLTAGNNALLSSGNTSSAGTNTNTVYSLMANVASITATSAGTVTAALPLTKATQLYLSTSSITLPVTLINFNGVKTPAGNLLNWQATNAVNFSYFGVQRSADANSFATIGQVTANSSGSYSYTDATAIGTAYYRLTMVDLNGATAYSNVVELTGGVSDFTVQGIYPVPTTNLLNVIVFAPGSSKVIYTVTDMGGRVLSSETHIANGNSSQQLNVSALAKGTYILKLLYNGKEYTAKFTKM
jgi:hypothetical protein